MKIVNGSSQMKLTQHGREGSSPMAESQLCIEINFGHGALEFGEEEERVIAEATGAARSVQNDTVYGPIAGVLHTSVASGNEDAVIAGLSLIEGGISETLKEDHVVPDVGIVVGVRRVDDNTDVW